MMSRRRALLPAVLACLALLWAACSTPIGIVRGSTEDVHRELTANVLSTEEASEWSQQGLRRNNLFDRFEDDPVAALAEFHELLQHRVSSDRLFALAELSFLHAERSGQREYYLAAAAYAYAFILPANEEVAVRPSDPRYRLAVDLYNLGISRMNTPDLRNRYQYWVFQYSTGQPVLYSAMLLRRALHAIVAELDPDGKDPALRRMVLIGHSQGGLLIKLMAIHSGTRFWDYLTAHSIIAVKRKGPLVGQTDGVVSYGSAYIDGVESEKIVRSGHSTQGHPETIEEVRRILWEHLGSPPAARVQRSWGYDHTV